MPRPHRALLLLLFVACTGGGSGTDADVTPTSTSSATGGTTTATTGGSDSAPTTSAGSDSASGTTSSGDSGDPTGTTTDAASSTGTSTGGDMSGCTPGEVIDCYSGPPATRGVGLCAAGKQTCEADRVWGPCVGEVLPAAESCDSPGDEDCDGVDPCDGDGGFLWGKTFGGPDNEAGARVGFDGAGNLVIVARGESALDFGGGALSSAGGYDVFFACFGPDGEHLWSKGFGDASSQYVNSVALAVDADGEIAAAGGFLGTIDFGGGPLVNTSIEGDLFLVRLAADGQHVWSQASPSGGSFPRALAFDPGANIVLAGAFHTSLDLGGGGLVSAGADDAFVGKFGPDGAHLWSRRYGDAANQFVLGLVTDAESNIYLGGGVHGAIDFGDGPLVSVGDSDAFLARLDPQGAAVWSKRFGDAQSQVLHDLAIDGQGRLVLGGQMYGFIDLGDGPIGAADLRSFIAQFDTSGEHLWSHLVSDGEAGLRGVAVDGPGSVLLVGDFWGVNDFGGGNLTSAGDRDIFVVKLGTGGQHVWSKRLGDVQAQQGHDVAGSGAGAVAITGSFLGGIDLGRGLTHSAGEYDGYVAVFGP